MKLKALALITAVAAIGAFVYAACDEPGGLPWCTSFPVNGTINWPCCDQTKACPINGTKFARFYRHQSVYQVGGAPICKVGSPVDGPTEPDECCGDPVGDPEDPPGGGA